MRDDPIQFAQADRAPNKRPRYVVKIEYPTASIYCTSHADITGVPGTVLDGVLQDVSAISQRLIPDEGRTEIGSFSFSLVDLGSQFTDTIRSKLQDDSEGIRRRRVTFLVGYEGFDFSAFVVFCTQLVTGCTYRDGAYSVRCAEITREQRKNIFENPATTTLRDNISESDTTVPVYFTSRFAMVAHGTSWSDAPSATVGYLKIEDEIIRYTGIVPGDSFTGCTRGALNTKAVAHQVDAATAADRRTKVEEYIYLELPAVKLAWAILTGELYGTSDTLPDHWHLGIDPSYLRESDFTGIGTDLWDTSDDSAALILRFEGLEKTDGKRFLETEIYLLLMCYSPVYADGTLGLHRLPAILSDAATVITLTEREVISAGELTHDLEGLHNVLQINWNYDVRLEKFTRPSFFVDADSITIHDTGDTKSFSFRGLYGSRHTDAMIRARFDALRDAYASPPERISITVPGSLSYLETGDVIRLQLANVRDFAGSTIDIDRSFIILNRSHRALRNEMTLDLFGSTSRPGALAYGEGTGPILPDAFYSSEGTDLGSIITIVGT